MIKQQIKIVFEKIQKSDFWKNLFKNSFWAFLGDGVASVINLVITIILIRLIGNYGYGLLILSQSYIQIVDIILNVQCWKSVIQYGQKALVNKKISLFYGYVKIGCILDITTALIGGIIAFFISSFLGNILGWSKELILCSQIFSFTIFFHFSGTTTAILRLTNKFNLVAVQKIISSLIKCLAFLIIWLWKDTIGIVNAVIVYSITDIIGHLLLVSFAFLVFRKKYNLKKCMKSKFPKDTKSFIKYTLWGTLSDIVDIPINYFDVFIISFLNTELVAVFKVFKQIVSILTKITTPVYQAILPQFSELSAKGLKERGFNVVKKIRKAILCTIGPCAILIGITSPIWLKIFFGEIYATYWYVLLIFLIVQTAALSYTTIHPYFMSLGKSKESTLYVFFANIIYVIITFIMIRYFGMISLVIGYFIQSSIVIIWKYFAIKKELKEGQL